MAKRRLVHRKLRIWSSDYLVYRYLWPNILWAISRARSRILASGPLVVDVGCGQKPYADQFNGCRYWGLNRDAVDACPDVLGDATRIPMGEGTVDIVFGTQVIEHVPDPKSMVQECWRILKPDGFLILTGPFYWPLHEEPLDFHRFTKYGFEYMLREAGFSSWEIKPDGGYWAQVFLSLSLAFETKWTAPLRVLLNCLGVALNKFCPSYECTSNYTVLARK